MRVEEAFVDGFCVTWTTDSSANTHEAVISLKFNFLSTDFSRSKGVKGVPVRLCAKTQILRSDDENKTMEAEPENCYCVVRLFRDHRAERKFSNDKTYIKRRNEKINKQIIDKKRGADLDGRSRRNTVMNGGVSDILPQKKRKWSTSSGKGSMSDEDLHTELATMAQTVHRPVQLVYLASVVIRKMIRIYILSVCTGTEHFDEIWRFGYT